jgi:hypothetical protein
MAGKSADLDECCNNYCYVSLVDAREAATEYLGKLSGLSPAADAALQRAAELYREVVTELKSVRDAVPLPGWMLAGKPPQPWTAQLRQAQADALRHARSLEAKAIAELATALAV